ncbi:MAG: hypothetical protein EPN14_07845 [Gallionella sp.]|nr:MAG: hypothetical protein EPN14_07845 [Gallionella sp.]
MGKNRCDRDFPLKLLEPEEPFICFAPLQFRHYHAGISINSNFKLPEAKFFTRCGITGHSALACRVAPVKGADVDKPRNLAKPVTVE